MKTTNRTSGLDIFNEIPWGTHICHFYHTKADLIEILVPYFIAGLENNEFCLWLTDEPLPVEQATEALANKLENLNYYFKRNQIEILNAGKWYTSSNRINTKNILQKLQEKKSSALQQGFEGVRCAGNISWLDHKNWTQFAEFEKHADDFIHQKRIICICSYCIDNCRSSDVIDVGNKHRFTIIQDDGKCKVTESSEHQRMEKTLRESERRYRTLAENISDVIWTIDINNINKLTYVNPAVTKLLGYNTDEILLKGMEDVFTPNSIETVMKTREKGFISGKSDQSILSESTAFELEMIHKSGSVIPVEVKYSFICNSDGQPKEVLAVARDISSRKLAQEQEKQNAEILVKSMEDTIMAMAMIVETRDPYTAGHQRGVAQLAREIAKQMNLTDNVVNGVYFAGLLHDIGKISIPAELLSKPKKLTETEKLFIKSHPLIGYEILKNIKFPWNVAEAIIQHHERMDGSGYPNQLKGTQISIEGRLLAVADVVEAMSSHRPYRPSLGINEALIEISANSGKIYDKNVAKACLEVFSKGNFHFVK